MKSKILDEFSNNNARKKIQNGGGLTSATVLLLLLYLSSKRMEGSWKNEKPELTINTSESR